MKKTCVSLAVVALLVGCSSTVTPADDAGAVLVDATCPTLHGPAMVPLTVAVEQTGRDDRFCIDTTEVSRAQYAEFVAAGAPSQAQPGVVCAHDTEHLPDQTCLASSEVCQGGDCADHPQVCIDVCDAAAYCAWAGKSLCGAAETGELVVLPRDAGTERRALRWTAACGGGLDSLNEPLRDFPYGPSYQDSACNTENAHQGTTPVGSLASCRSAGEPELLDLSGNVAEFVGLVKEQVGDYTAQTGGGSYPDPGFEPVDRVADYGCGTTLDLPHNVPSALVGFRCCSAIP